MGPLKEMNGLVFFPIPEFDDVSIAFGANERSYFDRRDLPEVPEEYERIASSLFFDGGDLPEMHEKVDRNKARRAVQALLTSWAPAHEAKIATVGYALWLWADKKALD